MTRTPRVLLVTDAAYPDETTLRVLAAAARALSPGELAVQLREKTRADRATWARRLREATASLGVALVINGDVALARAVGADGVHFGSGASDEAVRAGEGLWRSMAAHDDGELDLARARAVDAVLVSPVFASHGKGAPRGVAAVAEAVARVGAGIAVLALGGVGADEAAACFRAGAAGVAVVRALLEAEEPGKVARSLAGRS